MRRFFSGSAPACAPRRALMVKRESGITTMTVGLIAGYQQAENYVASGKTDLICLARGAMWDQERRLRLRPQLFPKRAQAAS